MIPCTRHLHGGGPPTAIQILLYSWILFALVTLKVATGAPVLDSGTGAHSSASAEASSRDPPIRAVSYEDSPRGFDRLASAAKEEVQALNELTISPLLVEPASPTLAPSAKSLSSSIAVTISDHDGHAYQPVSANDTLKDGPCGIQILPRRSGLQTGQASATTPGKSVPEIAERALVCSQIDEQNYRDMVKSIYELNRLVIEQIHIVNSESILVFSAIDLICDHFDCSKLTVFNVTGQRIHDCSVLTGWLNAWPHLEVLDLSNTSLSSIESIVPVDTQASRATLAMGPPMRNLTHLHLDENNITSLDFNFLFNHMPHLKHLSLTNNFVLNILCNESLRSRLRSQLEIVNLAGNAINCDKSQLWLLKLLQNSMTNLKFPDHDKIYCSSPKHFIDLNWAQRINVHETRICDECSCQSLKRTAIQVDCHYKNLSALPDILPLNTKILNLTSNRISSLGVPTNSRNWENVTYLHLEDNLISSFQQLNSKFMRNLAALDIRRNRFQEFPSHILEQFVNLDQVHLSDNPWLCDCESTFAFQEWLQRHFHQVSDKEEIRCGVSGNEENGLRSIDLRQRLSSRVIYKLSKSELCPQDIPYDSLDVINLILGLAIFSTLTKVVVDYFYQRRTKRLPHFFKLNI